MAATVDPTPAGSGLDVRWDGPVLRLTLDRPAAGNSLTGRVIRELIDSLDEAMTRDEVRVVALGATGRHYCTGIDLTEANQAPNGPRPRVGNHSRRIEAGANRLVKALAEVQLPVVAAVRGWAAGVGMTLALSADYIVADRSARFWTPFVTRGFTPDSGSTFLLPRLVGLARAKQMILLGRPVDADAALAWGMIHEVVDADRLASAAEAVVTEFAHAATASVGLAKTLLHRNLEVDLGQALSNEAAAEEVSLRSADFKEGMRAFAERRDPVYRGR